MVQNLRVTAFTVFELFTDGKPKGVDGGGEVKLPPRVKY